jgi:predicted GNAT family acetyltransferase
MVAMTVSGILRRRATIPDMAQPPDEIRIVDNPAEKRYEARLGDRVVGVSEYELDGDRLIFVHTEVDPTLEGKGVGGRLAAGALDDARARGLAVIAECPFISAYLKRHREYADILAR